MVNQLPLSLLFNSLTAITKWQIIRANFMQYLIEEIFLKKNKGIGRQMGLIKFLNTTVLILDFILALVEVG
jgi:hypothetical protein